MYNAIYYNIITIYIITVVSADDPGRAAGKPISHILYHFNAYNIGVKLYIYIYIYCNVITIYIMTVVSADDPGLAAGKPISYIYIIFNAYNICII